MLTVILTRGALVIVAVLVLAAAGLRVARGRHERRAAATWRALTRVTDGTRFTPALTDGLPEPARRYLNRAIAPGTPLAGSVEFTMAGSLRLRPQGPALPMYADEILAPCGLVWGARVGTGWMRMRGFDRYHDGQGELRWWLWGLLPVVTGDGPDVSRSAAGRVVGELVFLPSQLLPVRGARWEAVDPERARVTRHLDGHEVTLTLSVDPEGRLTRVSFMRWRDDPGGGEPGPARFDVILSGERAIDGYRVPATMQAGWKLDAPDGFPFFEATIERVRYR